MCSQIKKINWNWFIRIKAYNIGVIKNIHVKLLIQNYRQKNIFKFHMENTKNI